MDDADRARLLLASQLATVGSLAGGLIHEINNTIGFVSLASGQLERMATRALESGQGIPAEQVLALASEISSSARHARDDVASFQAVAGISRARLAGAIDVAAILNAAATLAKTVHRTKATIQIDVDQLSPCPPTFARLGPVAAALLLNALQASSNPSEPSVVQLRASTQDDTLTLEIYNPSGQPSTERLDELFEPWISERPAAQAPGLGLFLVDQTVRGLGGSCVMCKEAEGTRVVVRVPVPEA